MIQLGDIVLVNTPGRAVGGREQFAAIVTELYDEDDSLLTVFVMMGTGLTSTLRKVKREDTINRDEPQQRNANGWQVRP